MIDLSQFHKIDRNGNPTSVYDYRIFEYLSGNSELFFLGGVPWLYKNGVFRPDQNGSKLKTRIMNCIFPELIRSNTIDRVYRLFGSADRLQKDYADLNQYPKHWINFRNGFFDTKENAMVPHSPKYYAVNQIPYDYFPDRREKGKQIDSWLQFAIPDADDREMLLQFSGLCLTRDVSQQKFLIVTGSGGTGKSLLIRLIEDMVGQDDCCHIPLQALPQRFASYGLLGKTLNSCADLDSSALEDTGILKQIIGEDQIRAEAKGKDAFFFKSYAKLIFSANELPLILSEKTDGFFRRLMILKMDTKPKEVRPDYLDVLEEEMPYWIQLSVQALQRLYQTGRIHESDNSKNAVQMLRNDSDTVEAWLSENCSLGTDKRTERSFLFQNYEHYCSSYSRTALTKQTFFRSLETKGFQKVKSNGVLFIKGIELIKGI